MEQKNPLKLDKEETIIEKSGNFQRLLGFFRENKAVVFWTLLLVLLGILFVLDFFMQVSS